MASQSELQTVLQSIMGTNKVYFQPPESSKMTYPCIVYSLSKIDTVKADDLKYGINKRYSVTLIDKLPTTTKIDDILALKYCQFDRHFVSDNLHHFVFDLYY